MRRNAAFASGSHTGGHSLAQEHWFGSRPVVKPGWWPPFSRGNRWEQTSAACLLGASCLVERLMDHLVQFPPSLLAGSVYVQRRTRRPVAWREPSLSTTPTPLAPPGSENRLFCTRLPLCAPTFKHASFPACRLSCYKKTSCPNQLEPEFPSH